MSFRNESCLDFTDISSEIERTYTFTTGFTVTINHPKQLNVSPSGGHRIFAEDGCHYIQPGWVHLKFRVHEDAPHFVK